MAAGKIDNQGVAEVDGDILIGREEVLEEGEPLLGAKKARLLAVYRNDHIELLEYASSPVDDVEVSIGGWVEGTRENRLYHGEDFTRAWGKGQGRGKAKPGACSSYAGRAEEASIWAMKMPRLLGGAAASAFLLALGLPNEAFLYGQPVLGAVALIPLYLVLLEAPSWKATFLAAGCFGALAHGFSSYWLFFFHGFAFWTLGTTTIAYFFVYGVYGLYLSLFLKGAGKLRPLAFALGWIVLEYAKSTGFLGYPWGLLAYTQTKVLPMLQLADLCGVYGPSLILALLNGALAETYWALRAGKAGPPRASALGLRPALVSLGLALLLLGANLGYGAWRLAEARPERARLQALLVQQNLDPWEAGEEEGLGLNIDLARAELARTGKRPDIILFSESTLYRPYEDFPSWYASHPRDRALIPFIKESGAWLFTGAPIVVDREKEEISNSVILIDPQGRQTGDYAKVHPVPFAESIPFWDFPPFRHFIQNVVGLESGWTMGKDFSVFTLPQTSGSPRGGAG